MDKFIQKLDFDLVTTHEVVRLIGLIDRFKGNWNGVQKEENRYLHELRGRVIIESTGASVRLDGYSLANSDVQNLKKNTSNSIANRLDEQNAIGYFEALDLVHKHYSRIDLSGSYIKKLHQLVFKYSTNGKENTGGYRRDSGVVSSKTYPGGGQRSVIVTANTDSVAELMSELLEWTNNQLGKERVHPLIVIAIFMYEFLSIHPFEKGNGRLSRLLLNLCLLQNDYRFIRYVSFENHMEQHKKSYNEALKSGQGNRGTTNESIDQWLLFFLRSLRGITEKLERDYRAFKSRGRYLNERQKGIKNFIAKNQPVKIGDITKSLPDVRRSTLKKDLQYMRAEQVLTMIGKGKGSIYILNENE